MTYDGACLYLSYRRFRLAAATDAQWFAKFLVLL